MPDADTARELAEAAARLAARDFQAAHGLCLSVLTRAPDTAEAFYLLGVIAAEHDNHQRARDLFDKAIQLAPGVSRYHAERGRCRIALSDREGAKADAALAMTAGPRSARVFDMVGVIYSRLGLHAEALPCFRAAVERAPTAPAFLYNLGAALQFLGDFDAAEAAFRRAIGADPAHARAWSSLVLMRAGPPSQEDIKELERLFPTLASPDDRLNVGHALAKAYEDLGHPLEAMTWLEQAKALKRGQSRYDGAELGRLFGAAAATLKAGPAGAGAAPDAPIFIVGLPRTGTTLVDRILSSHSDVVSAGELSDFAVELKRAARTPSPLVLDAPTLEASTGVDLAGVGRRYIERARQVVGDAPRFIDKMPLNFFYVPLILAALPNARVICLRRHPADTVLSNYRQLFATAFSYYTYALDQGWTADYYSRFDALMGAYRASLPESRFTEIWYEDIVRDLETEARRIVAFCGLDWQADCLAFHRNAAPVATASASQVRRPLYASSVGRWRRYRAPLAPALQALRARGIAIEDDA